MSLKPARLAIFIPPVEGQSLHRVEEATPQFIHTLMEIWGDCACIVCQTNGIPIYWYKPTDGWGPTEYQTRIAAQILKSKYVQ